MQSNMLSSNGRMCVFLSSVRGLPNYDRVAEQYQIQQETLQRLQQDHLAEEILLEWFPSLSFDSITQGLTSGMTPTAVPLCSNWQRTPQRRSLGDPPHLDSVTASLYHSASHGLLLSLTVTSSHCNSIVTATHCSFLGPLFMHRNPPLRVVTLCLVLYQEIPRGRCQCRATWLPAGPHIQSEGPAAILGLAY